MTRDEALAALRKQWDDERAKLIAVFGPPPAPFPDDGDYAIVSPAFAKALDAAARKMNR